jgi:hypothetical protein
MCIRMKIPSKLGKLDECRIGNTPSDVLLNVVLDMISVYQDDIKYASLSYSFK